MRDTCIHGHPLSGHTVKKRYCRTCKAATAKEHRERVNAYVATQTARWLADLPAICDDADRLAEARKCAVNVQPVSP